MVETAVPVQVVFQGGGARLALLLAACRALRKLEQDGLIRVTHCGGASAGAVAAAIISSGRSVVEIEQGLIDVFEQHRKLLSQVSKWRLFAVLFFGFSYFPRNFLAGVFDAMFGLKGKAVSISQFVKEHRDPPVPLSIYTTDLVTGTSMLVSPNRAITDGLATSCAFPLVFSGYGQGFEVDGGLASNLPVDDFLSQSDSYGEVIAFGFIGDAGQNSPNILRYLLNLFSAAIQSGVTRSELRLRADCNFRLDTDITTFDFGRAIEFLTNRVAYEHKVDELTDKLKAWVTLRPNSEQNNPGLLPAPIAKNPLPSWIKRFYDEATKSIELIQVQSQVVAEAQIYDREKEQFTDFVRTEISLAFLPKVPRPLLHFMFGAGDDTSRIDLESIVDLKIRAFDEHGNPISIDYHAEVVTEARHPYVQLWVDCGMGVGDGTKLASTTLRMSYTSPNPYPQLGITPDWSALQTRFGGPEEGTLVLAVSSDLLPAASWDIVDLKESSKLEKMMEHVSVGCELIASESLRYADCVKFLPSAVMDNVEKYRIFGRRTPRLDRAQVFGLAIERKKGT
jgi:predicted acylesterase/phospholipase RssA